MTRYVALLRAVNVGGTGKLPMAELTAMCWRSGFADVRTYIASGNAVFTSDACEAEVKSALEAELWTYAGKYVGVFVRTAAQMAQILADSPFVNHAPNRTTVVFLDDPPGFNALAEARNVTDEQMAIGTREIHVSYGGSMRDSKLQLASAARGTARNMNTVAKLAAMAQD